jgi:hypothetical protein
VLALPEGEHRQLVIRHAAGEHAAEALGLVLPDTSLSAGVLATGEPVTVTEHAASRSPNRAAPQLISISRPAGSTWSLRRGSAYSSIAWLLTLNRHGWVLCTDGARAAVVMR